MGRDTHAVSGPAQRTALEVLAANGVETVIQSADGFTPTPAISRAILVHNRGRTDRLADGIVVTPSHNPPEDGGFKYNPPNGGPADTDVTGWIQTRANALLREGNRAAKRMPLAARSACCDVSEQDFAAAVRRGPAARHRHGRDPRGATEARGGPARRRRRPLLGADQSRLRPRHRSRQPRGRPDLLVHDRRSRRQDPHGLLESVRDGPPARAEGPVRVAFAQRPRRRPPRHRHAVGGTC